MRKIYKDFFKWFLIFSPVYIILFLSCILRVDGYVYMPGNLTDIKKEIVVDGYDNNLNGSVHSVYVMTLEKPTYLSYALASLTNYSMTGKYTKEEASNIDRELDNAIGIFDSVESFEMASVAAFNELKDKIDFEYIEVTYIYSANKNIDSNIKYTSVVGNLIKRIGNLDKDYPSFDEINSELQNTLPGESINILLEDLKGKTSELTIKKNTDTGLFGLTIRKSFKVTKSPEVKVKNVFSQGPSGGAMQSLYIYLLLNKDEDLLKGRNIAGTGTITYTYDDSNNLVLGTVGAIGCVGQKLYGAYLDHATVFYCPESNYQECMRYYKLFGYTEDQIRVVKVSTLNDIIEDLRSTK